YCVGKGGPSGEGTPFLRSILSVFLQQHLPLDLTSARSARVPARNARGQSLRLHRRADRPSRTNSLLLTQQRRRWCRQVCGDGLEELSLLLSAVRALRGKTPRQDSAARPSRREGDKEVARQPGGLIAGRRRKGAHGEAPLVGDKGKG